ncbi:MAG: hypothetical protein GXY20_03435 [Clostridiales bacterium]|nr:hypothetical protein [Clostridiales bacterium]
MKYAQAASYGNLAYDDFIFAPAEQPEEQYEESSAVQTAPGITRETARVSVGAVVKTAPVQAFSPFALLGSIAVAVLMLLLVLSYVSLAELSGRSAEYTRQLAALEEDESRLLIDYEGAFNLDAVEAYATNQLGMVKTAGSQVAYVQSTTADMAVIRDPGNGTGIFNKIGVFLSRFAEYFR